MFVRSTGKMCFAMFALVFPGVPQCRLLIKNPRIWMRELGVPIRRAPTNPPIWIERPLHKWEELLRYIKIKSLHEDSQQPSKVMMIRNIPARCQDRELTAIIQEADDETGELPVFRCFDERFAVRRVEGGRGVVRTRFARF